jgi:hypothetical protein
MQPRIEASPYLWPHDSTFDQKTTALVIIDMQKDCGCQHIFMTPRVVLFLDLLPMSEPPLFKH